MTNVQILSVVGVVMLLLVGYWGCAEKASQQSKRLVYWLLLEAPTKGSGGKKEALQYLNSLGDNLDGINLNFIPGCKTPINFDGIVLPNSRLKGVDFSNVSLKGANFENANLEEVNFFGATLENANFQEAILNNAVLASANLKGANLMRADLRGIKGLTCKQITKARHWRKAYRDAKLTCGAPLP